MFSLERLLRGASPQWKVPERRGLCGPSAVSLGHMTLWKALESSTLEKPVYLEQDSL